MLEENEEKEALKYANYIIEIGESGFNIFAVEIENDLREWVATVPDPEVGMAIVEGLILVEHKRQQYPDTAPVFQSNDGRPLPPFLRKASQSS